MIIRFWIWSSRNTRKTPSYPAHFRIASFCCQRADCPSSFPLSSACSCASTSCRSSSHCVSWLSESSTSLLSTFASSERSLSPRSATCCMSSRHRGQLSVVVEAVANCFRYDVVFTKAFLSCVPWSSRDCSDNSTGSHIFDTAWRLSSQRRLSTARALVVTPVEHMQHVLFRLGHRSQVSQLVGQIACNHTRCTVDRIIRANSMQLSLSTTAARS